MMKGDFIGFTFNNIHSSTLGIVRTSEGSRFQSGFLPVIQDKTVQVPGNDGFYYFGSYYTQKTFAISFAYDSMTDLQFKQMSKIFGDKQLHKLIFDEAPYKYYMAKTTGSPTFKYICFDDENEQRVYKGEGTINFICYYPFSISRFKFLDDYTINTIPEWKRDDNDTTGFYNNKDQWSAASGMKISQNDIIIENVPDAQYDGTGPVIYLYNAGELLTDWKAYYQFDNNIISLSNIYINADNIIGINQITKKGNDTFVRFNSQTNLIEGMTGSLENLVLSGNLYNEYINNGNFFKIPLGDSIFYSTGADCEKIEYNYLYY